MFLFPKNGDVHFIINVSGDNALCSRLSFYATAVPPQVVLVVYLVLPHHSSYLAQIFSGDVKPFVCPVTN